MVTPRKVCLLSTAAILVAARATFALEYTVTNLGSINNQSTRGLAINASGQIAGDSGGAFVTATPGQLTPADALGIGNVEALNDSGQAAGYSAHAYRVDLGAAPIDLGTLGGTQSYGHGINNFGRVVGCSLTAATDNHAYRTAPNAVINPNTDDLGTLGGATSEAMAINDAGQVTGWSMTTQGVAHAYRTTAEGKISDPGADLGAFASDRGSYGFSLNAVGAVVGYASLDNGYWHAFFVPAGRTLLASDDLGTLPNGLMSVARDVNNFDQIVGYSWTSNNNDSRHAVLWSAPGTAPIDLNALLPADSGWVLTEASSINDAGQITGWGRYNGDNTKFAAFVLSPVPEPASLALVVTATPLLLLRRRKA